MQQTDDLAAWLTQIWDEQERLAKAATPGPWKWQDPGPPHKMALLGDNGRLMVVPSRTPDVWPSFYDADFMEANHPGAVLARIAADRQILDLWRAVNSISAALSDEEYHGVYAGDGEFTHGEADALWSVLKILASAYADRPGYQEAWKPE